MMQKLVVWNEYIKILKTLTLIRHERRKHAILRTFDLLLVFIKTQGN